MKVSFNYYLSKIKVSYLPNVTAFWDQLNMTFKIVKHIWFNAWVHLHGGIYVYIYISALPQLP